MNWQQLLSTKRLGQEHRHNEDRRDDRSEFKRDYDRLIFSAPFRRLQNKTQVFPLPGSVFVHNRLTHSLEVASVGLSLGNEVAQIIKTRNTKLKHTLFEEIGTIVSAACLAHDMGNPPFGHSGEKAMQVYFSEGKGYALKNKLNKEVWSDLTHFEGNANALRLLTHRFNGRRNGGFALTYSTLASIVKYPYSSLATSKKGKFGFFVQEQQTYQNIAKELGIPCLSKQDEPLRYARHPLVYLVEAADDICYEIMDIEDSHKLKILTFDETQYLLSAFVCPQKRDAIIKRINEEGLTDKNEIIAYWRANAIGTLVHACVDAFVDNEQSILNASFSNSLIDSINDNLKSAYKQCAEVSVKRIYNSEPVLNVELSGYRIIETLMDVLVNALLNPNKFYSEQVIKHFSEQYDVYNKDLNQRIMAVLDYVSGMTDLYALSLYQKINGSSLPAV